MKLLKSYICRRIVHFFIFIFSAEVGMKEETGVVEGEEEGKEGEEKETVAGNGDRSGTQPAQADQPSQQGTKRSAPNSGTTGNGNSNTEQVQPAKQPQQLSGTKRSSGDTQESDDSDSRRKRRKDNNEPSDPTSSVESPGPKVFLIIMYNRLCHI